MTNKKFWDDYPEPIKSMAIANYESCDWKGKSLKHAFNWHISPEGWSPEGWDFWNRVNNRLYDVALALLQEEEAESVDETQKEDGYVDILHDKIDRLKAENEALKRTIREGVQQMRMKVWNDTFQTFYVKPNHSNYTASVEANHALEAFDKTFNTQKEKA